MNTVHIVKVNEALHAFADMAEAYAFYQEWSNLGHDCWFHGDVTVWPKGEGPSAIAERDIEASRDGRVQMHNGDPYCPYCTDGREPYEGETLCGQPGCRDYPHASDDERDHAETMPGKAAAEDISYKFEE